MSALELVAAGAGGSAGACARMWVLLRAGRRGPATGAALAFMNLSGSALAGALLAAQLDPVLGALLLSGVLGSFTTLSTWIGDLAAGAGTGQPGARIRSLRAVIELAGGLGAAAAGFALVA